MGTPYNLSKMEAVKERDDAGIVVALKDEQGQPYEGEVTVTVLGPRSRAVRKARTRNALAFADKRGGDLLADVPLEMTLDAIEDGNIEVCVAATTAWSGIVADGADVPCTPENARRLYLVAPHIVSQLAGAMNAQDADFRPAGRGVRGARVASGEDESTTTGRPHAAPALGIVGGTKARDAKGSGRAKRPAARPVSA